MNGDQDKAEEIFYFITLKDGFKKDVHEVRLASGIPEDGFEFLSDAEKWQKEHERNYFKSQLLQAGIIKKYKIQPTKALTNALDDHVISNGRFKMFRYFEPANSSTSFSMPTVEEVKAAGQPFIELRIYGTADKDSVKKYIDDKWPAIKRMHALSSYILKKPIRSRIKKVKNKELNEKILELSRHPIKTLREMSGIYSPHMYKEMLIAEILEKQGIHMKSEAIKETIKRSRKKSRDT